MSISREEIIQSLVQLKSEILTNGIPNEIKETAKSVNPWFTDFYIDNALQAILTWFEKEVLSHFLAKYPLPEVYHRKIGVIAAGNLPFVGLHDVLMVIFSGNDLILKLSHQDKVLMEWLIQQWQVFLPALKQQITLVDKIQNCDFLISTGSDNTATQIEATYTNLPKLIRKHRYSVAILTEMPSEESAQTLASDILLYNGLGCRNVSTLLTTSVEYLQPLINVLRNYPVQFLNKLYLEALKRQKAYLSLTHKKYIDAVSTLLLAFDINDTAQMGILGYILFDNEIGIEYYLKQKHFKLQCVVQKNENFVQTQLPKLDDFADNIDTLALLLKKNFR